LDGGPLQCGKGPGRHLFGRRADQDKFESFLLYPGAEDPGNMKASLPFGVTSMSHPLVSAAAVALVLAGAAHAADGKLGSSGKERYDPGPPIQNSTACKKQVAKIRKLENDTRFDNDRSIRRAWQLEVDVGMRMGCEF
jgi:hypothetical protein